MPDVKGNQFYDRRAMLRALSQMPPTRLFFRNTFFKAVETFNTKTVELDIRKGGRNVAAYVHPLHQGKVVERAGFQTRLVEPAYIKEKILVSPADAQNRGFGENPYQPIEPANRINVLIGEAMADLDERITRREEIMCAEAITTGKVHVKGEGLDFEVNFGYDPDKHFETLSGDAVWTDAGGKSDPLEDLERWRAKIVTRCGIAPTVAIFGRAAAAAFRKNEKVLKMLDIKDVDAGRLGLEEWGDGVRWFGRAVLANLDLVVYDEMYNDPETGDPKSLVPDNAVILGSPRAQCSMLYGMIQNLDSMQTVPRFPNRWKEDDGRALTVQIESAPMPNLCQVDAFQIGFPVSP